MVRLALLHPCLDIYGVIPSFIRFTGCQYQHNPSPVLSRWHPISLMHGPATSSSSALLRTWLSVAVRSSSIEQGQPKILPF